MLVLPRRSGVFWILGAHLDPTPPAAVTRTVAKSNGMGRAKAKRFGKKTVRRGRLRIRTAMAKTRKNKPRGKEGQVHTCSLCKQEGHRADTCPKKRYSKKARKPSMKKVPEWAPAYVDGADKKRPARNGHRLRALAQMNYEDLPNTEPGAKKMLRSLRFLPPTTSSTRACWKCGDKLKHLAGRPGLLRCGKKLCRVAIQSRTAYTPLHRAAMTYVQYLKIAYLYAIQVRIDQSRHMVSGVSEKQIQRVHKYLTKVEAWDEQQLFDNAKFSSGEVEIDGAKTTLLRSQSESKNVHTGRVVGVFDRASGTRLAGAAPDQVVAKGRPTVPESHKELAGAVKTLAPGSIAIGDSNPALGKALRVAGKDKLIPKATVNHTKKQWTKFQQIKHPGGFTPKLANVAMKRAGTSQSTGAIRLKVSTNAVEGLFGNSGAILSAKYQKGGGVAVNKTQRRLAAVYALDHFGLTALGTAVGKWLQEHLDKDDPDLAVDWV